MGNDRVPERALEPQSPSKDWEDKMERGGDLVSKADEIYDYVQENYETLTVSQLEDHLGDLEMIKEEIRDMMEDMGDYSLEDDYNHVRYMIDDVEGWVEEKFKAEKEKTDGKK